MDVIVRTKKFPTDSLFFLLSPHTNLSPDMLNRCRMNAITGKCAWSNSWWHYAFPWLCWTSFQVGRYSFPCHFRNTTARLPRRPRKTLRSKQLLVISTYTGKFSKPVKHTCLFRGRSLKLYGLTSITSSSDEPFFMFSSSARVCRDMKWFGYCVYLSSKLECGSFCKTLSVFLWLESTVSKVWIWFDRQLTKF